MSTISKTLRALGLAAALMSPMIAGQALADGEYISGPTAVGSWTQNDTRTPLAGRDTVQNNGVDSLEQSGATGGGGQHA